MKLLMNVLCSSMVGGLSVIVFWVVFRLCRKRVSAKYRKIAWVLIALCLILPLNLNLFPDASTNVFTLEIPELVIREQEIREDVKPGSVMDNSIITDQYTQNPQNASAMEGQSVQTPQKPVKTEITTTKILLFLWVVVALLLTIYHDAGYWVLNRRNARWSSECKDEKILNAALRIAREFNLKKVPKIRMMEDPDKGPFTIGLFRKVIYLPKEYLFEDDVEYVLKHEMAHCKEHDLFWKFLFVGVNIIHWFNPLVWMLRKLMDQDMEVVCDETVVQSATMEERQEYGNVIMAWVERSQSRHQKSVFATSYVSGSRFLKRRFDSIFDESAKRRGNVLIGATVIVLMFFSCVIRVEAGAKMYLRQKIAIDYGIEVRTDVDGDGVVERVGVNDIRKEDDGSFTQVSATFSNGDIVTIDYVENVYSSELTVGDLSGNGAADVVVMKRFSIDCYGQGLVSVLHMVDGHWEEYPSTLIPNPSLDIEQPEDLGDGDKYWWIAWAEATIVEKDGKTLLRLIMYDVEASLDRDAIICYDCSYRENGWYIESAETFCDIYSTGKIEELTNHY